MTRDELVVALTERVVEGMDMKSMQQYCYEQLSDYYDNLSMRELQDEARNMAPDLIDEEE